MVLIEQDNYPENTISIAFNPEQIPTLIKWLQEAQQEFAQQ